MLYVYGIYMLLSYGIRYSMILWWSMVPWYMIVYLLFVIVYYEYYV